VLNVDAVNAFNSVSREKLSELVSQKLPALVNYYNFLYGAPNIIDFDHQHRISMSVGNIQGLTSSTLFYSAAKNTVKTETLQTVTRETPVFKMIYGFDYVDDGVDVMKYQHIEIYLKYLTQYYNDWKIKINLEKTNIIMKTNNPNIQKYVKEKFPNYQYNFSGQIKYLGVSHGLDEHINEDLQSMYEKLQKKLLH
jgi:hypothetical protein